MKSDVASVIAAVLIATWIGAAILLAASVAPAAFAALPSRTLAGDVVGKVLPVVFISGMVTGLVALALFGPATLARRSLGVLFAFACAIAQFQTGPAIARLRAQVGGPIDALAPNDPQRLLFGRLHAMSIGWLAVAMLAAFTLLILSLRAMRQHATESSNV
jgi:hypothetical protein